MSSSKRIPYECDDTWLGDVLDPLQVTIKVKATKLPRDLTGATSIFVRVKDSKGNVVINDQPATLADATGGVLQYALSVGEIAYNDEFTIEWGFTLGGKPTILPPIKWTVRPNM